MTLIQLQYFQVLAHTLHYTRSAEKLCVSQPSLSYAINELEKELGVELFRREKKKVILTAYGQQFLPYVERSLLLLQEGTDVLRKMMDDAPGIVRMGYFHSVSASLVPMIVESFIRDQPNAKIRFQFMEGAMEAIMNQISSGVLDCGFSLQKADWLEAVPVMEQPLYLVVSVNHPLAKCSAVHFEDFAKEPQVMLDRASNLRGKMDMAFVQHDMIPNIAFEVRECNAALQYVSMEFGVAVLPPVPAMDTKKVKVLPILDQTDRFVRMVYFIYPKDRPLSPATKRVCEYIKRTYNVQD